MKTERLKIAPSRPSLEAVVAQNKALEISASPLKVDIRRLQIFLSHQRRAFSPQKVFLKIESNLEIQEFLFLDLTFIPTMAATAPIK